MVCYQRGLITGLSMWSPIYVVSHKGGLLPVWSHQCGLSRWSFINVLSLISVISYLGFHCVETNKAGLSEQGLPLVCLEGGLPHILQVA